MNCKVQRAANLISKSSKYLPQRKFEIKIETSTGNSASWNGIYLLVAVGLCIRVTFAFISDNIYYPDELFQYLEQAHRLVFGYGYVPWEYRFGTRSWITPAFIAIWLFLCKILRLDNPSIYIPFVKGVFCVLSISLIFSAYTIGKNLASEKAGRLAGFFYAFGMNFYILLTNR